MVIKPFLSKQTWKLCHMWFVYQWNMKPLADPYKREVRTLIFFFSNVNASWNVTKVRPVKNKSTNRPSQPPHNSLPTVQSLNIYTKLRCVKPQLVCLIFQEIEALFPKIARIQKQNTTRLHSMAHHRKYQLFNFWPWPRGHGYTKYCPVASIPCDRVIDICTCGVWSCYV